MSNAILKAFDFYFFFFFFNKIQFVEIEKIFWLSAKFLAEWFISERCNRNSFTMLLLNGVAGGTFYYVSRIVCCFLSSKRKLGTHRT